MRNEPAKSHTHPWTYPSHAWSRIHVDFAGPISNQMYFVIVDAYSKYPEVIKMSSTSASEATYIEASTYYISEFHLHSLGSASLSNSLQYSLLRSYLLLFNTVY